MVPGSDLDIWHPPYWPPQHTDSDGKVQAYKENGRYQNPWMNNRPSVASFFWNWFTGPKHSNIHGAAELAETLRCTWQKFEEELEINDFPQQARWKVTSKEALAQISEYSEAGITVRGTYYAPGKAVPDGERKLYLVIESTQLLAVQKAKVEITRLLKEELLKLQTNTIQDSVKENRLKMNDKKFSQYQWEHTAMGIVKHSSVLKRRSGWPKAIGLKGGTPGSIKKYAHEMESPIHLVEPTNSAIDMETDLFTFQTDRLLDNFNGRVIKAQTDLKNFMCHLRNKLGKLGHPMLRLELEDFMNIIKTMFSVAVNDISIELKETFFSDNYKEKKDENRIPKNNGKRKIFEAEIYEKMKPGNSSKTSINDRPVCTVAPYLEGLLAARGGSNALADIAGYQSD